MVQSPRGSQQAERSTTVPTLTIQQDSKGPGPKDSAESDWATFVTLPSVGKGHTIQLLPREERLVQEAGMVAPRPREVQGSGWRVRFAEGTFQTNKPELIKELTESERAVEVYKFGTDYDINRSDPTGYWRKHGWAFKKNETFVITSGPRTVEGPVSSMAGAVA